MRLYLFEILSDTYNILEAKDGTEGLAKALESKPDIIVTDIMMEPMDGITFCQNLKNDTNTKPIPVIMLTALSSTVHKVEGLELGAEDYVTKPFHTRELLARIANIIQQRTYLKELFSNEFKLAPKAISVASAESVFIQKLISLIERHMDNPSFDVDQLASEIGLSRSQLHRKITTLTGQSTTGFMKIIRIKRAAQLLEQKAGNISEIMYMVGFNNLSYFAKSFKEVYQVTPSEYSQNN
jgi:YesN/AraC family two-component response regulator